jgi:hypothetical protein
VAKATTYKDSRAKATANSNQRQLRPRKGGRYNFKGNGKFIGKSNGKGWRSEDRRYNFNCKA